MLLKTDAITCKEPEEPINTGQIGKRNVNPTESSRLKYFAVNSEEQAVPLQQLQNDNNISAIIGLTERRN